MIKKSSRPLSFDLKCLLAAGFRFVCIRGRTVKKHAQAFQIILLQFFNDARLGIMLVFLKKRRH